MQFIAQVPLAITGIPEFAASDRILLIFQCQNDPGLCGEWDPNSGGNKALIAAPGGAMPVPPTGEVRTPSQTLVIAVDYDDSVRKNSPDDNYCAALDRDKTTLGKQGGNPLWIQGDETPTCTCGTKMAFAFQLEAHGGGGLNFGDCGSGYAFACPACRQQARFLFQCS